jgi:hypothetical protein
LFLIKRASALFFFYRKSYMGFLLVS